jgi:hypothetical protein
MVEYSNTFGNQITSRNAMPCHAIPRALINPDYEITRIGHLVLYYPLRTFALRNNWDR